MNNQKVAQPDYLEFVVFFFYNRKEESVWTSEKKSSQKIEDAFLFTESIDLLFTDPSIRSILNVPEEYIQVFSVEGMIIDYDNLPSGYYSHYKYNE